MDHVGRILAQWRSELPELDTAPMAVIGRVKRLSAHLNQAMERVFAAHRLNRASFDVLATLRRAGPPYALSPSALMKWTMVTSGTMTNRLDRLEDGGLITRSCNPDDGRGFSISLTPKGRKLIDQVVQEHVANQRKLVSALTDGERQALEQLLCKWLGRFEKNPD